MANEDLISRSAVMDLIQSKFVDGALEVGDRTMIDGCDILDEVSDLPRAYDIQAVEETLGAIKALAEKHAKKMCMEVKASDDCPWLKNKVFLKAVGTHELEKIIMSVKEQTEILTKIPEISEEVHSELLVKGKDSISFTLGNKKELIAEILDEDYGELYIFFTVRDIDSRKEFGTIKIDYASSVENIRNALEDFLLYPYKDSLHEGLDYDDDDLLETERI